MMTMTRNANRTNNNIEMGICPVTGEKNRKHGCVLCRDGRQEFETLKREAMAKGLPEPDIFAFAASEGARTIARLQRELQRNRKEEDARFAQILGYAEAQVAEQLRLERRMEFADQHHEKVETLAAKLAPTDQVTRKIRERAKKLGRKIQFLQAYLRVELPRMRADARKKHVENWFADLVREPEQAPEMAIAV